MKLSIVRAETKSKFKVSFYGVVIKRILPNCLHVDMANELAGFYL